MDLGANLTLLFSGVAAAASVATIAEGLRKANTEKRDAENREAELWSMKVRKLPSDGEYLLEIRYEAAKDRPIRLLECAVMQPKLADIATCTFSNSADDRVIWTADADKWGTRLPLDRDLEPGWSVEGGMRALDYALLRLMLQLPTQGDQPKTVRLTLSILFEERSALRQHHRIKIRSHQFQVPAVTAS